MEHNVGICKRTQCETTENQRVLTSVYGPLSSEGLGVVFLCFHNIFLQKMIKILIYGALTLILIIVC